MHRKRPNPQKHLTGREDLTYIKTKHKNKVLKAGRKVEDKTMADSKNIEINDEDFPDGSSIASSGQFSLATPAI